MLENFLSSWRMSVKVKLPQCVELWLWLFALRWLWWIDCKTVKRLASTMYVICLKLHGFTSPKLLSIHTLLHFMWTMHQTWLSIANTGIHVKSTRPYTETDDICGFVMHSAFLWAHISNVCHHLTDSSEFVH